jgi:hypothetical protein|tara:strand:+ start:442 stop:747 length:306 start_codon:yes stop_codon:yes gene_type:complete
MPEEEEEEEEWEWNDLWEKEIPLTTKKRITAGSIGELLQLVDEYLQDLDGMEKAKKPRIPLINFHMANNPEFKGMKILPTSDSLWKAILFFDDRVDLNRRN